MGQINPDLLRANKDAVSLIKSFADAGKTVAAICHAPWLLIEAGIIKGRAATTYASIATDVKNAGAHYEDSEVVVDQGIITSRSPEDLDAEKKIKKRGNEKKRCGLHKEEKVVIREGKK